MCFNYLHSQDGPYFYTIDLLKKSHHLPHRIQLMGETMRGLFSEHKATEVEDLRRRAMKAMSEKPSWRVLIEGLSY